MNKTQQLSKTFSQLMREYLTPEQLAEVNRLNEQETDVCHTHDYLDANVIMDEAYFKVFAVSLFEVMEDQEANRLANDAWNLSKENNFQ